MVQLENTAKLQGIKLAVGLPDLHPGKGNPIGAAFMALGWIYPHLVGSDIGCGMGLWRTDLKVHKIKLDKWIKDLSDMDGPWQGDIETWRRDYELPVTNFDQALGTIGGGNHFAELQKIEEVVDQEGFDALGLDKKSLYLLVHSGSRGLGESILQSHLEVNGYQGLNDDTPEAQNYIMQHNQALKWAKANRALIAYRFLSQLRTQGDVILDIHHNTVTVQQVGTQKYWLHRKGAAPATEGLVIIPGSRGDFSYLVRPIGPQDANAYSLAHGAGRKWKRSDAKAKLSKYRVNDFIKTKLGSLVICEDKDLIFEEAPQAYKNISSVVGDLIAHNLIKVIAILRPVITYKTRRD